MRRQWKFAVFFIAAVVLPSGACIAQRKAFLTLCDCMDLLVSVPLGVVTPAQLRAVINTFLDLCVAAKWERYMHPKFHWMIHLPGELARHGFLPTCFVHERKHRIAKRYANDIRNTRTFERSLLGEVLSHNLALCADPESCNLQVGLARPIKAPKALVEQLAKALTLDLGAQDVKTSSEARLAPAGRCFRNDIVLVRSVDGRNFVAGEVWAHSDVCGEMVSVISLWNVLRYDRATTAAEWSAVTNP